MQDDPVRALLQYVASGDIPRRVLLVDHGQPVPKAPRGTLAVSVVGGVARRGTGLAAQLLAMGVEQVLVARPPGDDKTTTLLQTWRQTLGDGVGTLTEPARFRWRHPDHVVLGQVPTPRRMVLGLPVRSPIDLSGDTATRTVQALALLRAQGRAPGLSKDHTRWKPPLDQPASTSTPVAGADRSTPEARAPGREVPSEEHAASRLVVTGCTACDVCVQACPTGALSLHHDGPTSTLTHDAERCRSAAQCVRLCPAQAVQVTGRATFAQVLDAPVTDLAALTTTTCPRCQARHPGDPNSLCPPCHHRQTHPFTSNLDYQTA